MPILDPSGAEWRRQWPTKRPRNVQLCRAPPLKDMLIDIDTIRGAGPQSGMHDSTTAPVRHRVEYWGAYGNLSDTAERLDTGMQRTRPLRGDAEWLGGLCGTGRTEQCPLSGSLGRSD